MTINQMHGIDPGLQKLSVVPTPAASQEDTSWWQNLEPPDEEYDEDVIDQPIIRKSEDAIGPGDGSGLTDALLAERIALDVLSDRFCWSAGLGWLRWTGKRWKRCDEVSVIETVRQYVVNEVQAELPRVADDWRTRNALTGLLGRGKITAMTALARGIVEVDSSDFDAHPDLLNTQSGIVDLKSGKLRSHDPAKLLTKITRAAYYPGATHVDWDSALMAVPEDCRTFFQVRVGQAATGYMAPDDAMLFLQGGGENGKSTVINAIMNAIGDYAVLVSDRVLTADASAHPTELMDFRGARLAVAEELPEGRRLSVKRLKDTVGTPRMKARYIRQDPVEWEATHSFFQSTNYLPAIEETDHGTWRRLMLLKFPFKFLKGHEKPSGAPNELPGDPTIRDRVKDGQEQQEAVLAWVVEGARAWFAAGKTMPEPPKTVVDDTRAWRAESDLVLRYWSERIEGDPTAHIWAPELYKDFNAWLVQHGHREWSDKLFVPRFGGHDETARNHTERKKIRSQAGISRLRPGNEFTIPAPVPTTYWAWMGVRFTDSEAA